MRSLKIAIILLLLAAIIGCTPGGEVLEVEETPEPTLTLPAPQVFITPAPDVNAAVDAFMEAWRVDDYSGMYRQFRGAGLQDGEDFVPL